LSLPQCLKAKTYSKEEVAQIEKIDVVEWANQSQNYLPIIYKTYAKINDSYVDANFIIIQQQIQKAGIKVISRFEGNF
jgi:hypothetical protein